MLLIRIYSGQELSVSDFQSLPHFEWDRMMVHLIKAKRFDLLADCLEEYPEKNYYFHHEKFYLENFQNRNRKLNQRFFKRCRVFPAYLRNSVIDYYTIPTEPIRKKLSKIKLLF